MLHLAPERSLGERLFNLDKLDYLTADLMVPNVDIRLDLTKAGISNQAFDLIVCNHILEHIKEDGLALEELNRILREDGKLFLTVSTNRKQLTGEYRSSAASSFSDTSQDGHYREYGLDLADKLEDLGFSVKVVWYMRQFSQQEALRLGLKNEVFFICKKNQ
jgi:SAM-dependent methyltransferase